MTRKAKLFLIKRSQAVRLPKEFQFKTGEVFICKRGENVILSPRYADWSDYLAHAPVASPGFMEDVEDMPVQHRSRRCSSSASCSPPPPRFARSPLPRFAGEEPHPACEKWNCR